jgi:hypothetical protein
MGGYLDLNPLLRESILPESQCSLIEMMPLLDDCDQSLRGKASIRPSESRAEASGHEGACSLVMQLRGLQDDAGSPVGMDWFLRIRAGNVSV